MDVLAGFRPDGSPDLLTAGRAARTWRDGGLVALPTETVYGLAADAQDPAAVERIYQVKGRPADHPLIVHVADASALLAWCEGDNPAAEALVAEFWPGPLTVVVPRSARAGDHVTGGQDTVAIRSPGHPVALACLRAFASFSRDPARGVAAPSANRFGRVSPTGAGAVLAELGAFLDPRRDLVIDGGSSAVGVESTIVDCTGGRPRVLRPGAIGQAQVDAVLLRRGVLGDRAPFERETPRSGPISTMSSPTRPDDAPGDGHADAGGPDLPRAPGMLESHYAPSAEVIVLEAGASPEHADRSEAGLIALAGVATPKGWTRLCAPATVELYAHELYAGLRHADELGVVALVAVLPSPEHGPLAAAIADRLRRAAHASAPDFTRPARGELPA